MNDLSKYADYIIEQANKVISYAEYWDYCNQKNRLKTKKLERLCGHTTEQRKK